MITNIMDNVVGSGASGRKFRGLGLLESVVNNNVIELVCWSPGQYSN